MKASSFLRLTSIMVSLLIANVFTANAQNVNNALTFSNQAVMFGDQQQIANPITGIMPGVALGTGFAAFLDNPASLALINDSFGEFGLSFNTVDENASFLGTGRSTSQNDTRLSNIGLVYRFPTERGSLVVGGGYNQHTNFNRAAAFNARNENSSITDFFKISDSYADIAFNTFATDFGDEFQDWDESILRLGFDQPGTFLGMRQQGEIVQSGFGGEWSAFLATEFQKNIMVGASIGFLNGRFTFGRTILESDDLNLYDSAFIDSNGDGTGNTDIDSILLTDRVSSEFYGFRARVGSLVRLTDHLNIGASYTFPTRINVEEDFDATIRTTMDNGDSFNDSERTRFDYSVRYPQRIGLGAAIDDFGGFSLSVATEYVNYASTEVNFRDDQFFEEELAENEAIADIFDDTWNFRGGVSYRVNPIATVRAGYQYTPSRFKNGLDDRNTLSLGAGFMVGQRTSIELGGTYSWWDENTAVFTFGEFDYSALPDNIPPFTVDSVDAARTIDQFRLMTTIRFALF
ncbi:MAG: OmpP1/FadL family transporter [Balneolaceae bacterium]